MSIDRITYLLGLEDTARQIHELTMEAYDTADTDAVLDQLRGVRTHLDELDDQASAMDRRGGLPLHRHIDLVLEYAAIRNTELRYARLGSAQRDLWKLRARIGDRIRANRLTTGAA